MKNSDTISVIIPTYNGENKILNILRSLEKQEYKDFETIVVVDGSTDKTRLVLEQNKFILKSFKIIEQTNKGRAGARNTGVKEAKGNLLIFFDDDMRPNSDCITSHILHHTMIKSSICVGSILNDSKNAHTEIQKYKGYVSSIWEKELRASESGEPLSKERIYITAANFSIGKDLFTMLGGFDERLNDLEDFDFAIKAYLNHIPIFFNKKAFAWHDENHTLASYINRRKGYFRAKEQLKIDKPETLPFIKKFEPDNYAFKRYFFWFFSFDVWVSLIDRYPIFKWLPQKIKFKMYDFIITSRVIYFP